MGEERKTQGKLERMILPIAFNGIAVAGATLIGVGAYLAGASDETIQSFLTGAYSMAGVTTLAMIGVSYLQRPRTN